MRRDSRPPPPDLGRAPEDDPDVRQKLSAMGVRYERVAMQRSDRNPFGDLLTLFAYFVHLERIAVAQRDANALLSGDDSRRQHQQETNKK